MQTAAGPSNTAPRPEPAGRTHNNAPSDQPSPLNEPQLSRRFLTPIYAHLVATGMLGYFKSDDGVSYRSSEGTYDFPGPITFTTD